MSEARREKRKKVAAIDVKTLEIGAAKITFDAKQVKITFPYKTIVYKAVGSAREYVNYSMLFNNDDINSKENLDYGSVLIGIEMFPAYGHSSPELTKKMYDVILTDFEQIVNVTPRDESQEELDTDTKALIDMQIQELLQ